MENLVEQGVRLRYRRWQVLLNVDFLGVFLELSDLQGVRKFGNLENVHGVARNNNGSYVR